MSTVTVSDSTGVLGIAGKYLRGLSSLSVVLGLSADAKIGKITLDGTWMVTRINATPYNYGTVDLSEGVHALVVDFYSSYGSVHNPDGGWSYLPIGTPIQTVTVNIEVKNYTAPSISAFSAQRCLSDGTPKGSGTYIKYTLAALIDPVTVGGVNKNLPSIKFRYRLKGTSVWTDVPLTTTLFTLDESAVVLAGITLSASNTYDFGVYVSDRWKYAQADTLLPRDIRPFNAKMIGELLAVCIGTLADEAGKFKVVLASKFTEVVEFVKAPVFGEPKATRDAMGINLAALGIQFGTFTCATNVGLNNGPAITFPVPFASAPRIAVFLVSYQDSGWTSLQGKADDSPAPTASGFMPVIYNSGASARGNQQFWWLAIGDPA